MAGAGVILRMYQRKEAPAFVVRLHKRGKPGKVIIFAIAHKIVRTAWRLLKDHVEFKETNDWRPVRYEEVRSPRSKRAALALTPESDSQARVNDKPVIGGELDLLADGKEAASKTGN
jgi:hypothetical protein